MSDVNDLAARRAVRAPKPIKILIAEDEVVSRTLLRSVVEQLGYVAIGASNGRIALEVLQDNTDIRLLITDMEMPELSGGDLIKRIRQKPSLAKLPVIAVSVHKEALDTLAQTVSLTGTLEKPPDRETLRTMLELFLQGDARKARAEGE